MKNTAAKGNAAERYVAKYLESMGWVVASRRHIGGSGDLLAVLPESGVVRLIEVKCCQPKRIWGNFERPDRQAMRDTKLPPGSERLLVNKVGKEELVWYPESRWP